MQTLDKARRTLSGSNYAISGQFQKSYLICLLVLSSSRDLAVSHRLATRKALGSSPGICKGCYSRGCSPYHTSMAVSKGLERLVHVPSRCWETTCGWGSVAEVFIQSRRQAILPRFPQDENLFQIQNSLK